MSRIAPGASSVNAAAETLSGGKEVCVSLMDRMITFAKRSDWTGCETYLAAHPPGDDRDERSIHAYWTVKTQIRLGHLEDALRRSDTLAGDFQCRCALADLRSEIYWRKGEHSAAIEALRAAPWGEEMDRFPALAKEAMFLYCYLLADAGREASPKLVDAIPDDYRAILFDGRRVDKADLLAAIERRRKRPERMSDG